MLTLNTALCLTLVATILMLLYKWYQLRSREKEMMVIGGEIDNVLDQLKANRAAAQSKEKGILDPSMLSTLITVIINKYGSVRLGVADFANATGEYVSVYVDPRDNNVILSTDHGLGEAEQPEFVNFTAPDDNTFH